MIFYINNQEMGMTDILTVRTEFYTQRPSDLTTISGDPNKYCRFYISTLSGIFYETDNIIVTMNEQNSYRLQYISEEDYDYEFVGYNL